MVLRTTTPSIFNPIEYFIEKRRQVLMDNWKTQDEFFRFQLDAINLSQYLKIAGYDAPFMEQKETLNALQERFDQNPDFYIKGIVFKENKISTLEELSRRNPSRVELFEVSSERKEGYIIFGGYGATVWDSTKLTKHPVERRQGVIRRKFSNHYLSIASSFHDNNFEKIRIVLL